MRKRNARPLKRNDLENELASNKKIILNECFNLGHF